MATESPMRLTETTGARKWPFTKETTILGSPLSNMTTKELSFLLKGDRVQKYDRNTGPSRSGSAPPSMEGSFAAIGNLLTQGGFNLDSSLESLNSVIENCESEEQLRYDPSYFSYYCSNVNLNPRLPPPLMSRENRRLVRHIGGLGNNWKYPSSDDSGNKVFQNTRGSLATHKEEPEDESSPGEGSEAYSENGNLLHSSENSISLAARHKSVVDLIQEDFPRTPSPVYNLSLSPSHGAEEANDHYTHTLSSKVSSIRTSRELKASPCSSDVCVNTHATEVNTMRLITENDSSTTTFPSSSCPNGTPSRELNKANTSDTCLEVDPLFGNSIQCGNSRKDLSIKKKKDDKQSYGRLSQHHPPVQQQIPVQPQVISQRMQTPVHTPVLNPPLYASAAACMTAGTPFYPSFQPSGIYSTHYGMSGYTPGPPFLPPFYAGYSFQGTEPMLFGASSGPKFDGRNAPNSAGEPSPHASELQHVGKFYGSNGVMPEPSFVDPLHLQYLQHPSDETFGNTGHQSRFASNGNTGIQIDAYTHQKDSSITAYMSDQNVLHTTFGSRSIPSPGKLGISSSSLYNFPPSISAMTQFPASSLPYPLLPSSTIGRINRPTHHIDMRVPQGLSRKAGAYSGSQGQRGMSSFDDPKRHYLLEELKSNSAKKIELSDITGRIVEFSVDQHGSRFIQQKLEQCNVEEKVSVFDEVLPHASKLMTDVFGNYVIQKFFEHGSPEQRMELANRLRGQVLPLSLQMYGCRVIQKAFEMIGLDQKIKLVQELDGHVMRCVHDQNGNHVIQKCIECVPVKNIDFIISAIQGQVATLSTHPYGCRVVQRILEHCSDELYSQCIVDEILESAYVLAQDQYGNYVIQHVLETGKPHARNQIIRKLTGKIVQMSQHKYASNVVEKCLEYGDTSERELLIEEIVGQSEEDDILLIMMKDQFANYVVQKILEISNDRQREILLVRIRIHFHALKKYSYGKHIVARFEQLYGEDCQSLES
ncbi:hypothetical protein K2173_021746 [Erythroxylum novogranatense]|uniref:PUM-HD domain-containing protein n=1 Tax=Erythroxylum novogranatense TaxID=1862640 RepID=A0AAV8TV36_9ROSI|nr:hypothetical protein K2173_021746 [Erythroxylum novogranatense]